MPGAIAPSPPADRGPPTETLAGLVERVTYHNAENGFCVLRVKARGQRDLVTVVGHAASISVGESVHLSGTWINDRALACRCGCTDPARLTRLGEDVTEVLEKLPARLKVIRHVRPRYACRSCETVLQAPTPDLPVERGRPDPGLLAHVLVSKYVDGLPLYRLSGILTREGVEIERQTLADWVGHAAWWLRPLAEAIGRHALAQRVIWTDNTPTRVLAPGRGKTREARIWVYALDPRRWGGTGPPVALYRYSADR